MNAPTLGRFRLIERVAQGGMGEVHRGVDVGWGGVERPVAVKVIAPEFARHPDFVQTFIDEAKLSFLLCHSNVVQVRDIGQSGETWFIAMEWVDGADLGSVMKRLPQALPLRFAVLVAVEAARGLDYAHRLRDGGGQPLHLVHRDVSPSNLLVSYEGEVKVTDFGIARWRMRQAISMPGALKGKIGYMAPEQARGEEVDARADVFSLGVVLYEMITRKNPFIGTGASEVQVLDRVRHGLFAPPSEVLPLPPSLEAIVLRAMAPDREQRYASCAALRDDLEAFARREAWALSKEHLGDFVRTVVENPLALALADTDKNPQLARRTPPTPAKARPFDAALGAQLAALHKEEPEEEEAPPPAEGPSVTQRGKKLEPKRTVALHEVIPAPVERPNTDMTDPIHPQRTPSWVWGVIALSIMLALGGGLVAMVKIRRAQGSAPSERAPVVAPAPADAPPELAPLPAPPDRPVRTDKPSPIARKAVLAPSRGSSPPARLSITSDVRANVYVDGEFVGEAPVAQSLAAGRHVVRVEGHAQGLRLLPKEETVVLQSGESRTLPMELK